MTEVRNYSEPRELPCFGQTSESIRRWAETAKVGDEVVVRSTKSDARHEYYLTTVIEFIDDRIVLDVHGTFERDGTNVFLRDWYQMLEPTEKALEAGRAKAVYIGRASRGAG